jgi:predicted DNA-binding transcriptional regulator YafY
MVSSAPVLPTIEDGMAKKRSSRATPPLRAVTAERAHRLCRLLQLLDGGPQTRAGLTQKLRLDVRGFYRDLELLRSAGIAVALRDRRYTLDEDVDAAIARLPFPDPHLTLGEAQQLAKGRTAVHRKLQAQIKEILPGKRR